MIDYASEEKKIRIHAVILRALINLIFSTTALYIFKRNNSHLLTEIGADTYRSLALIITSAIAADLIGCTGDLFSPKIYTAHFILNFIITIMVVLIVAAISGPVITALIPVAMIIPFLYHSIRCRKITKASISQMNEAMLKYKINDQDK